MKRLGFACCALFLATPLFGQDPPLAPSEGRVAPEVQRLDMSRSAQDDAFWSRTESPQDLVHRNAALRAAQRHARIEAMKAMGYSPSRPPMSTAPFMAAPASRPIIIGTVHPVPGIIYPPIRSTFFYY